MKNKVYIVSGALLASLGLLACGGGGDKPTPVVEKDMTISFKDPEEYHFYGDKINKDDLVVKIIYSDGTSKILSNDKYEAFTVSYTPIEFPISLDFEFLDGGKKSINIRTVDGSHAKTFTFPVEKYYEFEHGSESFYSVYYDSPDKFSLTNRVEPNGTGIKDTYKSNRTGNFEVDLNTGAVTAVQPFATFSNGAIISGYVDGIKVDQYTLTKFSHSVENIDIAENAAKLSSTVTDPATFNPNNNGKLYIPSVINEDRIDYIAANGFKGCTKVEFLELPDNLEKIGASAFEGCTSLETATSSLGIPEHVREIGINAFKGTNLSAVTFEKTEGWYCKYLDEEGEEKVVAVNPEYLKDKATAAYILTDEYYCDATYFN